MRIHNVTGVEYNDNQYVVYFNKDTETTQFLFVSASCGLTVYKDHDHIIISID